MGALTKTLGDIIDAAKVNPDSPLLSLLMSKPLHRINPFLYERIRDLAWKHFNGEPYPKPKQVTIADVIDLRNRIKQYLESLNSKPPEEEVDTPFIVLSKEEVDGRERL